MGKTKRNILDDDESDEEREQLSEPLTIHSLDMDSQTLPNAKKKLSKRTHRKRVKVDEEHVVSHQVWDGLVHLAPFLMHIDFIQLWQALYRIVEVGFILFEAIGSQEIETLPPLPKVHVACKETSQMLHAIDSIKVLANNEFLKDVARGICKGSVLEVKAHVHKVLRGALDLLEGPVSHLAEHLASAPHPSPKPSSTPRRSKFKPKGIAPLDVENLISLEKPAVPANLPPMEYLKHTQTFLMYMDAAKVVLFVEKVVVKLLQLTTTIPIRGPEPLPNTDNALLRGIMQQIMDHLHVCEQITKDLDKIFGMDALTLQKKGKGAVSGSVMDLAKFLKVFFSKCQ